MELRKRRGLMITLAVVTIGIPTVFLVIRLLLHAFAPKTYGPAGGYSIYTALVPGVLYVFGFIVAATLGCHGGLGRPHRGDVPTPGGDRPLAPGAVPGPDPRRARHHRAAGGGGLHHRLRRLRVRRADPAQFNGVNVPVNLSRAGLETWAADHADEVICNFGFRIGPSSPDASAISAAVNTVSCGNGPGGVRSRSGPGSPVQPQASRAQIREAATQIARMNYADYARQFLYPSTSLMIRSGLWLELEAVIGFVVALGLGSLIGQRTVAVIIMIVLEVILTPILSRARIPHLANLQRGVVGLGHGPSGTGWAPGARRRRRRAGRG